MARFNRKSLSIITAATAPLVTTDDMKDYLRVDTADDDALIASFVLSATETVKQYIRRALINETLELTMDGFNHLEDDEALVRLGAGTHIGHRATLTGRGNEIDLPFPPIVSITSIKTYNRANTEATFDSSKYELDETGGRVYLNESQIWPSDLRSREAVKVRYVAGYGSASTDVPAPIIDAVKSLVSEMYDCRSICGLSKALKKNLSPYKLLDYLGA